MPIRIISENSIFVTRHQFKNLKLEEISLPEGLEEIRAHAFRNSKLKRIRIPSTVKKIGFGAFSSCDYLEEVILPESIQSIGQLAFSACENLKTVINFPDHGVGERAFYEYRLSNHRCPWCGAALNEEEQCSANCDNPYEWIGSLRLYKGLFWWDGKQLITVKVHCNQLGTPSYSVRFFEKESCLGNYQYEWQRMRETGDPRIRGIDRYNDISHGLVRIKDFKATVFLQPELNQPKIRQKILNEFGLCTRLQSLAEVRFISDFPEHYQTNHETE